MPRPTVHEPHDPHHRTDPHHPRPTPSPTPPALATLFPGQDRASTLARRVDWAATPLGDPDGWPPELTAAVRTVLPATVPMLLCWGEDLVQLHNDAFRELCGPEDPDVMGRRASDARPPVWSALRPRVRRVLAEGVAVHEDALPLVLDRHGRPEQVFWCCSVSPVRSAVGGVLGILVVAIDVTALTRERSRSAVLQELVDEQGRHVTEAETRADHLAVALRSNRTIGMAIGVLMARRRLPAEGAFELLRRLSTTRNRKLRDLAEEVVHTGDLPAAADGRTGRSH
ncbi:ANTAR domain-containing protein [Phycicoccus sp. MAQZ13P-2]|uniref:ANTAR domain-containing protein n=1 Tax=Phycicoccus mangrovi TaxID=2840470 RepID=UPI001BFFEF47|nr:ANTAR domain-containing protein [Phycicoccus mangrovi]MBT9255080.1 ANTAR domain-containing protein [Phycicoccus mangrovi]MBT9274064.1 ANTAR domain-containing protein [Phycicoccus mangrovi]